MAVAVIDEDDDENVLKQLDEPVSEIKDVDTAKIRISALTEDKQRKTDYQERLERKLLTLDTMLAQQRDEVESLQRTLHLERQKDAADADSRKIERSQKTAKQEDRIRDTLSDVLYRKLPPLPGKKHQTFELDTVLISFIRPNDNMRYNLPFRVDNLTTLKHLRDDACKYWGVSTEDFILKTMGNSKCQNEIMVQDCFKQGEIAQLRLEVKTKEQTSVTEAEYKAIAPKNKKGRGRASKDKADLGVESVMKFSDRYGSTLKKMGGIYFLLKLRDLKPSEHCSKIKPRDCFIYFFLAVLTFIIYYVQRLPGETYWLLKGIDHSLFVSVPRTNVDPTIATSANVPAFPDLQTHDDVWDWFQITLPHVLWRNATWTDQSIASYNSMKGYVNIRQKTLKEANPDWQHCEKFKNAVTSIPGARCPSLKMTDDDELTSDSHFEGLKRYWDYHLNADRDTDFIRGPAKPWQFVSAEDNTKNHDIGRVHGNLQVYDAGGYSVEYRTAIPKKAAAENKEFYLKDMRELRQKHWINNVTTRAVFVSFNIYNYHYDCWVSVDLTLEMPPSGRVVPSYEIRQFIPNLFETTNEYMVTYIIFLRMIIAGYIVLVVGFSEIRHKTRNQKAGYQYYTSVNGVCDVIISLCIAATIVIRFAKFNTDRTADLILAMDDSGKSVGFKSFADIARDYEWLFILEGIIFSITMFRLISLFRINRTIYLLWHTLGMTLMQGLYLCLLFVPTVWFFTICAHRIWGRESEKFESLSMSFLSVYHMSKGALNVNEIVKLDTILAGLFYLMLYIFVTFLLLTGFAAVFVESYYIVQLTQASQGEAFGFDRWKNWFVHPVILSLFHFAIGGSANQSQGMQ